MDNATSGVYVAQRINSGGCYTVGGGGLLFYVFPKKGTYEVWADSSEYYLSTKTHQYIKFVHLINITLL